MTREEIMADEYSKLIQNWEKAYRQHPAIFEAAHKAMEKYSKQQGIKLIKFIEHAVIIEGCSAEHLYDRFVEYISSEKNANDRTRII